MLPGASNRVLRRTCTGGPLTGLALEISLYTSTRYLASTVFGEVWPKVFSEVCPKVFADLVLSALVVMTLLGVGLADGHWHAMFFLSQAMEHTHLVLAGAIPPTGTV